MGENPGELPQAVPRALLWVPSWVDLRTVTFGVWSHFDSCHSGFAGGAALGRKQDLLQQLSGSRPSVPWPLS